MSHLFLTEARIHQLLELAKKSKRDYALLHVMASTALRSSDILRIKVSDMIDNDGEIVRLLRLKMKKVGRYIELPLRDDCREAVRDWIWVRTERKDKNPYLFCSLNPGYIGRKKPLSSVHHHKIVRKYLEQIYPDSVLQGCSTHTLRRSVAKLVYTKTGQLAVAQQLLGHTNPTNTIRYLDPEDIRKTANKVLIEDLKW